MASRRLALIVLFLCIALRSSRTPKSCDIYPSRGHESLILERPVLSPLGQTLFLRLHLCILVFASIFSRVTMRNLRSLVVALAATVAALPGASAAVVPPLAADSVETQTNEIRALPASGYFDLKAPSLDLFRHKTLQDDTVQQGFAFDQQNRRLFVSQRRNGAAETAGDLTITQLDLSGKNIGHMYLKGFGHGVAFAAQGVGKDTYLWTEVDASKSGYGQQLARFKFVHGKTLSKSTSGLTKFKPFPKGGSMTCVINPVDNTLVVRYQLSGAKWIAAFPLASATKGDFSKPLVNFKQPDVKGKSDVFQGYAAYGQYLYVLTGTSYEKSGGAVNSEVASIDMNTGTAHQKPALTKAGESLEFREPEGMGVYTTAAGEPRLFLGFASGKGGDRRSNLFYKKVMVKK